MTNRKYAIFGRRNEYFGEVLATSAQEALAKARLEWAYAEVAIQIVPGGDFGVNGLN